MGQGESKLNGSFTFAYLSEEDETLEYSNISSFDNSNNNSNNNDNGLIHTYPEIYGLSSSNRFLTSNPSLMLSTNDENSTSTLATLESLSKTSLYLKRPDSGYISPSYEEDMQLAKDLTYVDKTYYHHLLANVHEIRQEEDDKEGYYINIANGGGNRRISFADVMLSASDKATQEVYLSSRCISGLSPNIGMLTMIRKLDLSNNHLTELPESIGYMQSLEILLLAKNKLRSLPETIGYLSNLLELDASYNQLKQLTPCISYLDKLKSLSLAFNQISRLPVDISSLVDLVSLDLTRNPLRVLPAEISQLPLLRRLRLEGCPFEGDGLSYPLKHNPPSLVEICARNVIRSKKQIIDHRNKSFLPQHLISYIKSAKPCTSCHGPYFESYVLRGRLIEKSDMQIPLEYTLCSAHWSHADDRILSMFCALPETSSNFVRLPYRPMLPTPYQQQVNKKERLLLTTTNNSSRNYRARYSSSCSSTAPPPPPPMDSSVSFTTLDNNILLGSNMSNKLRNNSNRRHPQQQRPNFTKLTSIFKKSSSSFW
ncbi:MAG: hypothetical protein EXX96DRAFT_603793 [Benjaminiella poitrasii]|nr:MAG: hypothetical protein EXX96DRAFT_603793 [Benjaminiella poitrasii]